MQGQSQGQNEGQGQKLKKSDTQIFVILLFVSFGFLLLTTPAYTMIVYYNFVDYTSSAKALADFQFVYSLSQKLYYTNFGINFYLYVISDKKFRADLMQLLKMKCPKSTDDRFGHSSDTGTKVSNIESSS